MGGALTTKRSVVVAAAAMGGMEAGKRTVGKGRPKGRGGNSF